MAILAMSGAESGSPWGEPAVTATATGASVIAGAARSGSYGFRVYAKDIAVTTIDLKFTSSGLDRNYWGRAATKVVDGPLAGKTDHVWSLGQASGLGGVRRAEFRIDTSLNLGLYAYDASTHTLIGSTTPVSLGTWYVLEIRVKPTSGADEIEGWVNGIQLASGSASFMTAAPVALVMGCEMDSRSADVEPDYHFDDLAVNDDTGADPNTNRRLGDGTVTLLKPVSDNARGANWFAGAGGTTNLYAAVDNTPPVGKAVATPPTDITQIYNSSAYAGTAADLYDANMDDYTNAGVPAGETIRAVQGHADTAEADASAHETLALKLVSNPAGSEVTMNWTEYATNMGVFPDGWKGQLQFTGIEQSPSVTRGTDPVFRIGKRSGAAGTRDDCDFMGINVESGNTPPVSLVVPRRPQAILGM